MSTHSNDDGDVTTDPVDEQLAAYNAHDIERFVSCYAADVVTTDADNQVLCRGRAQLRHAYATLFQARPAVHAQVSTQLRIGPFVIHDETVSGVTQDGGCIRTIVIYRVEKGRISKVSFLTDA